MSVGSCVDGAPKSSAKSASQSQANYNRALAQANRIGTRIGDKTFNAFDANELPPKPKRMRWKTYRTLEARQRKWKAGASARFGLCF